MMVRSMYSSADELQALSITRDHDQVQLEMRIGRGFTPELATSQSSNCYGTSFRIGIVPQSVPSVRHQCAD